MTSLPTIYPAELKRVEADIKKIADQIRRVLAQHNIGTFNFSMKCSGRTSAGNATLQYTIGEDSYSDTDKVRASTIRPALEEFLRRKGFDTLHAPLELPAPGLEDTDLEDRF